MCSTVDLREHEIMRGEGDRHLKSILVSVFIHRTREDSAKSKSGCRSSFAFNLLNFAGVVSHSRSFLSFVGVGSGGACSVFGVFACGEFVAFETGSGSVLARFWLEAGIVLLSVC